MLEIVYFSILICLMIENNRKKEKTRFLYVKKNQISNFNGVKVYNTKSHYRNTKKSYPHKRYYSTKVI